jgi:hypothetical protein
MLTLAKTKFGLGSASTNRRTRDQGRGEFNNLAISGGPF